MTPNQARPVSLSLRRTRVQAHDAAIDLEQTPRAVGPMDTYVHAALAFALGCGFALALRALGFDWAYSFAAFSR